MEDNEILYEWDHDEDVKCRLTKDDRIMANNGGGWVELFPVGSIVSKRFAFLATRCKMLEELTSKKIREIEELKEELYYFTHSRSKKNAQFKRHKDKTSIS